MFFAASRGKKKLLSCLITLFHCNNTVLITGETWTDGRERAMTHLEKDNVKRLGEFAIFLTQILKFACNAMGEM